MKIYTVTTQDKGKNYISTKLSPNLGKTLKHVCTTYWNQIPNTLTHCKTVQGFSNILKQHILKFY